MLTAFLRRPAVFLTLLLGGGGVNGAATPAEPSDSALVVITSNQDAVRDINGSMLREIYLRKIFVNAEGRHYVPVNLPPAHPLRNAFLLAVLHMNAPQLQGYWDRQYFQGTSPPFVLASQAAVVKFVAATPGAIGYVHRCYVTPEVHVVLHLSIPDSADAAALEKCPGAEGR